MAKQANKANRTALAHQQVSSLDGLLYEYRIMFAALLALQKAREANLLCEGLWHIPYFLLPRQVETKPLLHFVFEEASLWHL